MIIYTDGSAHPNPGPGGFGVVVLDDKENIINLYSHQDKYTTNNEQELKAILYTLIKYGKDKDNIPLVYTDSMYCYNTFTQWMYGWAFKDWCKADNSPIQNKELIQTYFKLTQYEGYNIDLRWIKGHNKNKWNDLADQLATGKYKIKGSGMDGYG